VDCSSNDGQVIQLVVVLLLCGSGSLAASRSLAKAGHKNHREQKKKTRRVLSPIRFLIPSPIFLSTPAEMIPQTEPSRVIRPHMLPAKTKSYNSGYSLVVTHLTTNSPVRCLNRAQRTGSFVFTRSITAKALKFSVYGNLLRASDLPCTVATVPAPLNSATYVGSRI
jgi:hypothetical protein